MEITDIMDICGWKSVEMPKRYIQQSDAQARRIGQRMEEHMAQQRAKATVEKAKERTM